MNMFKPEDQNLDFKWLKSNGWTVGGNLAFRHILHEFLQNGMPCHEQIEQIIMQYESENQTDKIMEAFREFLDLKQELEKMMRV